MKNRLICESHLKEFIKQKAKSLRPEWDCKNVSQSALDQLEAKLHNIVIACVKQHPTKGKTFNQVL